MSVCVCPSVTSRYCIETDGRIQVVLARKLFSTYPTVCYKEIRISPKYGHFPLKLCPNSENFATASRSCYQQEALIRQVWSTSSTVDEFFILFYFAPAISNHKRYQFILSWTVRIQLKRRQLPISQEQKLKSRHYAR